MHTGLATTLIAALVVIGCGETNGFEAEPGTYTEQRVRIEGDTAQRVVALVDSTFFGAMSPLLGRAFSREDYGASYPVVLISHDYWVERFSSRPDVIGSPLPVDGMARTIVGVMPRDVDVPAGVVLWLPREPGM